MTADSLKRKLTAILYCDVAGYSRPSSSDEEGTHRRVMQLLDLDAKPDLSIAYLEKNLPKKQPGGLDPYLNGLRACGLE